VLQKTTKIKIEDKIKMVTVQDGFDFMGSVFDKERALKMNKEFVITLNIGGPGGGTWQLIVNKGEYKFQEGNGISPITATLNYRDVESFYKLTTGEMSGVRGYASGVIKYDGSPSTIVSIGKLFSAKKFKKDKKNKEGNVTEEISAQAAFDFMESVFSKKEALKMNKDVVITYDVAGPGGGTWQLIMKNGEYEIQPGNNITPVTATVNYKDVKTFYKFTIGEKSGIWAHLSGAIKFDGPNRIFLSLAKIFSKKNTRKDLKEYNNREKKV